MRYFAFIALSAVALLDSSFALVDASVRTTVGVWANAWDERESGSGCSPDGCVPDLTRDDRHDDDSRWSCSYQIKDETCEICYSFAEPQDIVRVRFAMWKGDERVRKIDMEFIEDNGDTSTTTFTSSGTTSEFESIAVNSDETQKLCMTPVDLGDYEWLSILEVQFLVE